MTSINNGNVYIPEQLFPGTDNAIIYLFGEFGTSSFGSGDYKISFTDFLVSIATKL